MATTTDWIKEFSAKEGKGIGLNIKPFDIDHKGRGIVIGLNGEDISDDLGDNPAFSFEKELINAMDEAVILKSNTIAEKNLAYKLVQFTGDAKQKLLGSGKVRKLIQVDTPINISDKDGVLLEWADQELETPAKRLITYSEDTSNIYPVDFTSIPEVTLPAGEDPANVVEVEANSDVLFSNKFDGIQLYFKSGKNCILHVKLHDETNTEIAAGSYTIEATEITEGWYDIDIAADVEYDTTYHYHVYAEYPSSNYTTIELGTDTADEQYALRQKYQPDSGQSDRENILKIVDSTGKDVTDSDFETGVKYEVIAADFSLNSEGEYNRVAPENWTILIKDETETIVSTDYYGDTQFIAFDPCTGIIALPTGLVGNEDLYAEFNAWIGFQDDGLYVSSIKAIPENELTIESEVLNLQKPYVDTSQVEQTLSFKVKVNDVDKSIDFYIEDTGAV